jgi:hypothetical protein
LSVYKNRALKRVFAPREGKEEETEKNGIIRTCIVYYII